MELKTFLTVFVTVFLAELGDKTQIATVLFAGKEPDRLLSVFVGAALALIAASAIAVAVGGTIHRLLRPDVLSWGAGICFILIGIWTIVQAAAR